MYIKGFSVIEGLIAMVIITIVLCTAYIYSESAEKIVYKISNQEITKEYIPKFSDRNKGYDICFINSEYSTSSIQYIDIPYTTSALGRSNYIFVTTDSNSTSDPDLYILKDGKIISSLSTGPGLRDIAVIRDYAFVANTSNNSQLQKIDIHDLYHPFLVSSFKFASTGNSIRYDQGKVYIGAEKSSGPELYITDENLNPIYNYETNSQINDIYFTDKLYIAASDIHQLHIIGTTTEYFSPTGWETQEGKVIAASGSEIYFGRTVGGFNNKNNHELFLLNSTSTDIGYGVYGLISSNDLLFVATKSIQVWKKPFNFLYSIPIVGEPVSLSCDKDSLIVGLKTGIIIIKYAH